MCYKSPDSQLQLLEFERPFHSGRLGKPRQALQSNLGTANPDAHPVANEHLVWEHADKVGELIFHPTEGLGRFQRVERVWSTYARLYFERVMVTVWVSPDGDADRRFSLDWKMRIDRQQPTLRKRLRFIQRLFSRDENKSEEPH